MVMTHAQGPDQNQSTPAWKDAVLHARITIGGNELWVADIPNAEPMRSAYLTLNVGSDGEAESIFAVLFDGGQVFMALQETFFALDLGSCEIVSVSTGWFCTNVRGLR